MVVILDYGMGNVGSVSRAFDKIGISSVISNDVKLIKSSSHIVIAGVGSFDRGIKGIFDSGMLTALNEAVYQDEKPVLGICLGMQLMMESSEEGTQKGLGYFEGKCVKFRATESKEIKVPHMGWNETTVKRENKLIPISLGVQRFYFVHSYHVVLKNTDDAIAETYYGYPFASAINKGKIYGVQFHPEKSHQFGFRLLQRFVEVN